MQKYKNFGFVSFPSHHKNSNICHCGAQNKMLMRHTSQQTSMAQWHNTNFRYVECTVYPDSLAHINIEIFYTL